PAPHPCSGSVYPKPSISLSPSGGVSLGGVVTVWCRGQLRGVFLLYKDGNLTTLQDAEPAGDLAEFLIRNVSWRDAGSYSCYYHHYWYSFIWSHPSDPVELVVAGEGPGSVSPPPAPPPARLSGAGACARGKQVQGRLNQWDPSSELLRGAEPAPLAAGGTESVSPKAATFLFLFMPLIRGSLHQWGSQSVWGEQQQPPRGNPPAARSLLEPWEYFPGRVGFLAVPPGRGFEDQKAGHVWENPDVW
uniref:Ig-like domain-containing protein n=1 Tax=Chrysemys picta bellii TaxID=8478 RepID=A0A8C3FX69_CHRPI